MQDREPSMRAALALLGLAEGADREAVTHTYRRLARETHPDRSDAPDAQVRFAALTAAYRRALVDAEEPLPERAASPTVRITVHPAREDPFLRRPAASVDVGHSDPLITTPTPPDPPIVAGPVRVVSPSFRARRDARSGRRRDA